MDLVSLWSLLIFDCVSTVGQIDQIKYCSAGQHCGSLSWASQIEPLATSVTSANCALLNAIILFREDPTHYLCCIREAKIVNTRIKHTLSFNSSAEENKSIYVCQIATFQEKPTWRRYKAGRTIVSSSCWSLKFKHYSSAFQYHRFWHRVFKLKMKPSQFDFRTLICDSSFWSP